MEKIIIISGHGNYATGIKSSVELLAGTFKEVYYVDFKSEDSDVYLRARIKDILDKNLEKEVLFIGDILGGTPFKVGAELSYERASMEVVVGCNLTSIIDTILSFENIGLEELSENIVRVSNMSTLRYKKTSISKDESVEEIEEGI